jgi:hypothetical protein
MAAKPNFAKDVTNIAKTILPADTTAWVDVFDNSARTKSVRVESLNICSDDTATVNLQFGLFKGGVTYLLGTIRVVTLSGTDGAASRVSVLPTLGSQDPDGINVLEIEAGAKLQAKSLVAVTSAKTVTITGRARNYEV